MIDLRSEEELVPVRALDGWLGDRLCGVKQLALRRITAGHSNELFTVSRGGPTWVLRRPPHVPNAPGAHDMVREYRVLEALEGSAVPHATPRGLCSDPGVIGVPFYVADEIDGVSLYGKFPSVLQSERVDVAYALVDALAALHQIDWRSAGLEDFGRPHGYTERQAARWMSQLRSYAFRALPDLEDVATWLADRCPRSSGTALIHGDYGLHNVLFAKTAPARMLAVVDWETATIGDPLADLGYLLASWLEPHEWEQWSELGPPCGIDGFPARADLIARYAAITGLGITPDGLTWYRVLGQFKIAVILEGSYGRFVRGEAGDPFFATLKERVPLLARHALAIAQHQA